MKKNLLEITK